MLDAQTFFEMQIFRDADFFRDARSLAQMRCSDRWKILKLTHLWLLWEGGVYVSWGGVEVTEEGVEVSKGVWTYHDP